MQIALPFQKVDRMTFDDDDEDHVQMSQHFLQSDVGPPILNSADQARGKSILDAIHGHIRLPPLLKKVMDTPEFQRLRDLRQLGVSYFVYPCATHTRFEHSLGVSHLAGIFVDRFRKSQPELNITDQDVLMVMLAGLCHDLGHGPFSHVFDGVFLPKVRKGLKWKHEDGSKKLLDLLIENNNLEEYFEKAGIHLEEINSIKDMIKDSSNGETRKSYGDKAFLFDIVCNASNSIDVDKFDYLSRDPYCVGMKCSIDYTRLMKATKIINGEICYHRKVQFDLYDLFYIRASLFRRIYYHPKSKAIEEMICDIFAEADKYLHISDSIDDPSRYVLMTDGLLTEIERSTAPELQKSRALARRLRRRDLYKFVGEILLKDETNHEIAEQAFKDQIDLEPGISNDDIIIRIMNINYGFGEHDPISRVKFFNTWEDNETVTMDGSMLSKLLPNCFQEKYLRVYVKDASKAQIGGRLLKVFGEKTRSAMNINSPFVKLPRRNLAEGNSHVSGAGAGLGQARRRQRCSSDSDESTDGRSSAKKRLDESLALARTNS